MKDIAKIGKKCYNLVSWRDLYMKSKDVILVVDNELLSRKIISDILSEKYIVLLESDSRKALETLRERAEDISTVLLELNAPGFSGVDFLREYAKEEELKSIPVMMISTPVWNCC